MRGARNLTLLSLIAVLAGCATTEDRAVKTIIEAVEAANALPETQGAAPYAPVIPHGTGIFAEASALPFHAPDFSRIRDSDYQPAIEQGIAIQKAEMAAIAGNPATPTFANTIAAMEASGQMLSRANLTFSALTAANTNPVLDAADKAIAPQLAGLKDAIYLNERLFARIKPLHDTAGTLGLVPEQAQILKVTYDQFVHNGALLSDADKAKLRVINERLSSLGTDFSQKLTAGTKDGALVVPSRTALAGLGAGDLAAAAKTAADRKLPAGQYVLPLQNTTQQPMLSALSNRATRRALFDKSWNRSEQGDANDTRALIQEMAQLRAQKAALLGFADYASFTLDDQMVQTPSAAIRFMQQMVPPLLAQQHRDAAALNGAIRQSGQSFTVQPWDWDFYSEKLRKARFNLDDSTVKPYFEITRVLEDGVFYAANQLYGLTFTKRNDIPVYHPDVTVYTVHDADGSELALFYFDPWKRDNKQGGAWMSNFVEQSKLLGNRPVIFNVDNFTKPAAGQPALISIDDANTMFHEMGHALHGMLSDQTYPTIAGTNTARDFVEFPSQFNEHWMTEPRVFAHFAKHYQTGAPMPAALVAKVQAARRFNKSYGLGERLAASLLDMKWHALPASAGKQDVDGFETSALASTGLDVQLVPSRYRSSYFRHIWSGGYGAGYYAYTWTEMLSHDAFAWFEANGGMTRANGQRFRDTVLSKGHSMDYAAMYRAFAGRDPQVGPMLKAYGLE